MSVFALNIASPTECTHLTFLSGKIHEALENAETADARANLEAHISARLTRALRDLERFDFGTQESIDAIVSPRKRIVSEELSLLFMAGAPE